MKKFLLCLSILLTHSILMAQTGKVKTDTSREFHYEYVEGDPLKTRKYVLKNGLTIYATVNRSAPRIYTHIAVKAGSKHDPKSHTGLAHYLEHMLFKGTDKFGTRQYDRESVFLGKIDTLYERYNRTKDEGKRKFIYQQIDSISGIAAKLAIPNEYDKMLQFIGAKGTNAYTSFDETVYINDIPTNQLDAWIQIEAERFRNPIMRLFHTELEAVYEEKNISLDSDIDLVYEQMFKALFKRHSYGLQTTIGTVDHLKNPSIKAIREYFQKYYVPNNMAIILAGNFDPDETVKKIDQAFSQYKAKPIAPLKFPEEVSDTLAETISLKGKEEPLVCIGYRLPAALGEDDALMLALQEILYNNKVGLIDKNLVKKQRVLQASCELIKMHDYSALVIFGTPKSGQSLSDVKDLLLAQIDSLRRGKFSEEVLKAVLLNEETNSVLEMESNWARARVLTESFTRDLPLSDIVLRKERLRKIDKNDLMLFARKFLTKDFVVLLKEQGETTEKEKIIKPEITPVTLNRKDNSRFAKDIYDNEVKSIKPQFNDYKKSIRQTTFMPGVELYQVENKENSLFKLSFIFEFGKWHDKELPILHELLKLSGTNKLTSEGVEMEFYRLAANFNSYCSDRLMSLEISGPEESFERALSTLEHLLSEALPNQEVLNKLIDDELKTRENNAFNQYLLRKGLSDYALYGKDNPFNYVLSNKELKKLKADRLADKIHRLTAYPHQINYYGNLTPEKLEALLRKYHKIAQPSQPIPAMKQFKVNVSEKPVVYFNDFNMVQAEISWVGSAGNLDTNQLAASAILNEYFGGGMSSVVFQEIRESKALAYSCYANFQRARFKDQPCLAGAYVGTQADKLDSALSAMNKLIKNMPEVPNLFDASVSSLKSVLESERTRPNYLVGEYLALQRLGLNEDMRKLIYSRLSSMNLQSIKDFHQKVFANNSFNVAVLGSSKKISKSSLKPYGKVKTVKTQAIFGY